MEDNTLFKCAQQHRTRNPVHGKRLALQNSCFYEGVCQAPLNSDVQWFSGLAPPCAVVVMSYP